MPNPNPINIGNDGGTVNFNIPAEFSNTMIYLTIKIELLDDGWTHYAYHSIYLDGNSIYYDNRKEPEDLKANYGNLLHNKKMRIASRVDRIRNGANDAEASRVKYTLIVEAGDTLIDKFESTSTTTNPESFISNIKFQQA
jgi:hypothetical protein